MWVFGELHVVVLRLRSSYVCYRWVEDLYR